MTAWIIAGISTVAALVLLSLLIPQLDYEPPAPPVSEDGNPVIYAPGVGLMERCADGEFYRQGECPPVVVL